MRLYLGPVAPDGVLAWTTWAREVIDDLRNDPRAGVCLSDRVLEDIKGYVAEWERTTARSDGSFRWQCELPPEDLEYLSNAFYNLDLHLRSNGRGGSGSALPAEGRAFHLVLVRALLSALALESPTHAAFVDQMQGSWPSAVEAL